MHYLPGLVVHLHLLLRVVVRRHLVDLRYDVVGKLMRELVDSRHLAVLNHLLVLLFQLFHGSRTGSAGTLIAWDVYLLDMAQLVNRVQDHNHHYGGAVRIGNDATRTVQCVLRVYLRNDQRNIIVHAELWAIVDHHGSILGDGVGKLCRRTASCAGESDIDALEVIVMLKFFYCVLLSLERILAAGGTLRAEQQQVINREISLCEDAKELLSHCATGANNSYSHISFILNFHYKLHANLGISLEIAKHNGTICSNRQ